MTSAARFVERSARDRRGVRRVKGRTRDEKDRRIAGAGAGAGGVPSPLGARNTFVTNL